MPVGGATRSNVTVCLPPLAASTLQGWARWGFAARGAVHVVVGGLGVATAIDVRGAAPTDGHGALIEIFRQPLGAVLIGLLAVGLAGYSVWRVAERWGAREPSRWWRIALHVAAGWSALTHLALAGAAVRLVWLGHGITAEGAAKEATAELLAVPYGYWLVIAMGVVTIGIGLTCVVRGACARLTDDLVTDGVTERGLSTLARYGHLGHGVTLTLVGGFFLRAAWRMRSEEATSVRGVLRTLEAQPLGPWLLALVAAGILAFGLFGLFEAVFRRVPVRQRPG